MDTLLQVIGSELNPSELSYYTSKQLGIEYVYSELMRRCDRFTSEQLKCLVTTPAHLVGALYFNWETYDILPTGEQLADLILSSLEYQDDYRLIWDLENLSFRWGISVDHRTIDQLFSAMAHQPLTSITMFIQAGTFESWLKPYICPWNPIQRARFYLSQSFLSDSHGPIYQNFIL